MIQMDKLFFGEMNEQNIIKLQVNLKDNSITGLSFLYAIFSVI
jgi:hypothetical protein